MKRMYPLHKGEQGDRQVPEQNVFDIATDILKERLNLAFGELKEQFKGTNPYRKEPVSPKEQIYQYSQITPEMEMSLRQSLGDDVVDDYKFKMEKLLRRQR